MTRSTRLILIVDEPQSVDGGLGGRRIDVAETLQELVAHVVGCHSGETRSGIGGGRGERLLSEASQIQAPRQILFGGVPLNPTGKIEKPKMRKQYAGIAESFKND